MRDNQFERKNNQKKKKKRKSTSQIDGRERRDISLPPMVVVVGGTFEMN